MLCFDSEGPYRWYRPVLVVFEGREILGSHVGHNEIYKNRRFQSLFGKGVKVVDPQRE